MDPLIGHAAIRRELSVLAASEPPPHALLLSGPPETGRTTLAVEYARLLNCESGKGGERPARDEPATACGSCRPCHLLAERRHPDLLILEPGDGHCRPRAGDSAHESHADSRDIRICQVRGVIEAVSRFPIEARVRTVIVEPAERLGRDAAHALLKTLEEPPEHTVFTLVTAAPEAILETIRSRCRTLEVRPVPRAEIESGLLARDCPPELAAAAAAESRGRPVAALKFAASPGELGSRQRLLERCRRIASEEKAAARLAYAEELAERWRRDRQNVPRELSAWEAFWEERLLASADKAEEARGAALALQVLNQAREDLLAQVLARPVFEFMLLSFPTVTLESPLSEEAPIPDA